MQFYRVKNSYTYRIMSVLKVETDIITSIVASLTGWAVILVIMYIKIFKTGVIGFICDVKMCLTSHWPIIFNIRVSSCAWELQTDLIFLWIKVSSVIQTFSVAHIKGKMSNLPININCNRSLYFLNILRACYFELLLGICTFIIIVILWYLINYLPS